MPIKLETINFVIALLTLAVATYGVYYTRKCNHRKITISNGEFISAESNPPIARFEIYNISPLPITILGLEFLSPSGEHIDPIIGYDPTQTGESNHGPFDIHSFMQPNISRLQVHKVRLSLLLIACQSPKNGHEKTTGHF